MAQLNKSPSINNPDLFDDTQCPVCNGLKFTVLKEATYTSGINEDNLLKLYSASSHSGLLDQVVKCKSCDSVYLNPRPKQDIIIKSYQDAIDPVFVEQNDARIATFRRSLENLERRHGFSASSHPKILDVGCAGGAFLRAASDRGYEAIGIEPSRWMVDHARNKLGVDARQGILTANSFQNNSFDIVSLWDVLEHLPEPSMTLDDIAQMLKPGGFLIVNYPDIGSLAARVLGGRWPFWLSVHLTYYTRQTIRKQLNQCGFDVVSIKPYFQSLKLGYALERASVIFKPFSILGSLVNLCRFQSVPIRYNMGQTLVLARKRA
ncbi:class I SAM-dependent methyltransferase [Synoicihabitans lomoniglobus]|uniref:Class I SAM-dependent methyltransferase n=1 Tax=Synoicihabitans lomoniglobus TaxID=2909285 RepID=A0AAF0CSR9_9BACT|nr:class I SAM-dependent methyltransferase [Opitutaceae bacterium LMO-M01]WED67369.1 class I SAM-dependent methyltransferase [Opitutaceae bacterium LMO-M01]